MEWPVSDDFRYSEGAGRNTHAQPTNIGLIVNSAEFIPNNRTGWTSLMAWGSAAVFALITHEQPFAGFRFFEQRINGLWSRKDPRRSFFPGNVQ